MTGAAHRRRGGNDTGYVRAVMTDGGVRYHARLRNRWLGSHETRAKAQAAIEQARRELGLVPRDGGGDEAA